MNRIYFSRFLIFVVFLIVFGFCYCDNVKKSVEDNQDDAGEGDDSKDETLAIAVETEPANVTCTRRQNDQVHEIRSATHQQFPFMAAIMSNQNEYLCAGTLVANGLVLTTAHCILLPIRYVLLNTTRDRKDDTAVMLHVIKSEKFPSYSGSESSKDVGIIYTEQHNNSFATKLQLSNFTSASNVQDFEAIGFGLNSEDGQPKELQYVGLEHRPQVVMSVDIMPGFLDCIETKVVTCFKDSGGPVIVNNELYGIVVRGQGECTKEMTSVYSVNKRMVDVLATYTFKNWLDEKINKYEVRSDIALMRYPEKAPVKPVGRTKVLTMTGSRSGAYSIATKGFVFHILHTMFMNLCLISVIF